MPDKKALNTADHSLHSSYPEMLLEHLFVGEVMRHLWVSGGKRLEILKPQVDDAGYDLVFELGQIVRHIQLKTTFKGSTVHHFNVNAGLSLKPSGCVNLCEVPGIVGGRGAGKAEKVKLIGVGKKGSIIIPAEKVAKLGIGKDDKFKVRKTKAGIALKKV